MGHHKSTIQPQPSNDLLISQAVSQHIEDVLRNTLDGIIAFNTQGTVIAINDAAAKPLHKAPYKLINHYLWEHLNYHSISHKRQLVKARQCFQSAKEGLAQQFTWIENKSGKPVLAYNIMINKVEIHGTSVIFARLSCILQEKLIEWVLWSLAKLKNHHSIIDVIDEILKLICSLFSADYTTLSLVDNQHSAHSISHYHRTKRINNIKFSIINSPCLELYKNKSIAYFKAVLDQFPQDQLSKKLKISSFLGGAITNMQGDIVGFLTLFTKRRLEINNLNRCLFRLFIDRLNIEMERLLNYKKLKFMASIPQQDPNPILRIIPNGEVIFANHQGRAILQRWMDLYSGLPETILKEARKAQRSDKVIRIEMAVDNKVYLFTLIWIADFKQINIYGTDISLLKSAEKYMLHLAQIDSLTQIANRQYFEEHFIKKLEAHLNEGKEMALLLIDFDDFKIINDTLGHPIGDKLLKAAAKRMIRCLRQDDFIARFGGDEFIVLLDKSNTDAAIMVADKIISVLTKPFQIGEYQIKVTVSIGIAVYPETGLTAGDLLKHADLAMYQIKKSGKNNHAVFSKSLHFIQARKNEIIRNELKMAVLKNQLYVEYQPQINTATNTIIGYEAFLRWLHPELGLIVPNDFIPAAEQTGCIHLISQWMIQQSLSDFVQVLSKDSDITLSINISLCQLNDPRFIDSISSSISKNHMDKSKLILDISERTMTTHIKQIGTTLKKLQKNGIQICLDNFGSPQVSLPKLLALPINYLKLDPMLLQSIETSKKHRTLLKGIIELAKNLNIKVIQKGIETEEQHQIIKSLNCDYAQGFYYCPPMQLNDLRTHVIPNVPT